MSDSISVADQLRIRATLMRNFETEILPEEAALLELAATEIELLRNWIAERAVDDCRSCDGTGIYYGNVCLCGCVNREKAAGG